VDADFDHAATPYGNDLWKPAYTTLVKLFVVPPSGGRGSEKGKKLLVSICTANHKGTPSA
jgi:hypothetical protein